jgi:hypothetical protein
MATVNPSSDPERLEGGTDKEVQMEKNGKEVQVDKDGKMAREEGVLAGNGTAPADLGYGKGEDLLAMQDIDPALNQKMHLVNNVRLQSIPFTSRVVDADLY